MPTRPAAPSALSLFATLTALGLAGALPLAARAQSLTLGDGDAITVSGAGTAGHVGTTVYTAPNSATTYRDTAPSYYAVRAQGTSAFTLATGGALIAGQYDEGLYASGSGPVTITGGTITGGADGILDLSTGPVAISGGTFTGGQYGFGLDVGDGSGPVTVSGGTFSDAGGGSGIYAGGKGDLITVAGGAFSTFNTSGTMDGLYADFGGTIDLFSLADSPFLVNGVPMNNTSLPTGSINTTVTGTISGVLANGQAFSTTFGNSGTINLNIAATPEPSAWASLGMGMAGVVGLAIAARRRRASAV